MPVFTCASATEARDVLAGSSSPVVVVPVCNAYEDVVQCLEAVLRHSPPDTDLLVIDDASVDARLAALPDLLRRAGQRLVLLRHRENLGFVRSMNEAFEATGRRDAVVLNSDVIVGPEWLERLRAAAYSDSRIATATPLTNHGTIVSVPQRNTPSELPPDFTPEQAARAVAAGSSKLRPLLPTCIGHCVYIRRMALDLAGPFDETFSPGYGEEVDFSQRCTLLGLAHVCADDVFVYHRGSGSFGKSAEVERLKGAHEEIIARRYPFYHPWVASTANGRGSLLGLALGEARRALLDMTVAVDGSCLGPVLMGTQRLVLETIRALTRHPRVGKVIAVVPTPHSDYAADALRGLSKLVTVPVEKAAGSLGADLVYRPYQLYSREELERVRQWGERLVVTQLDLILFNNPGYCGDWNSWARYRDLIRFSLAVADGVAFLSQHTERESHEAGLIAPGKPTKIVYSGTDHFTPAAVPPESLPPEAAARGFVLCLGTDYLHKNRLFALRVFEQMLARGHEGCLLLAGLHVTAGSSRALEAEYLLGRPELARRVVSLAHIPDAARTWLYEHASLVLHPTLYEGFGLIPFEAALAGTPCLSSAQAALAELLPREAEFITEWDPAAVADQAMGLITDRQRRARLVDALGRRAHEFTWDLTAERLVELFDTVCRTAGGYRVAAVEGELGVMGTGQGWPPVSRPLLDLIDQAYPREFQEAMRAIAARRVLKRPLVGLTVSAYRLASALRSRIANARGRRAPGSAP